MTATVFAALGLGSVIAAVIALVERPPDVRGVIMAVCAPLFLGLAALVTLTRLRVRGRGSASVRLGRVDAADSDAVLIPYSRGLATTYVVMSLSMLVLFGLVAVVSLLVLIDGESSDSGMILLVFASGAATLYLLLLGIDAFRGAVSRGVLALAPTGVYHRSWAFTRFVSWDSMVSVTAGASGDQLITAAVYDGSTPSVHLRSRLWWQPELSLVPHLGVQGANLSVDPVLAYHALRFYQNHAEARAELGSQAGADRLLRADLLDQNPP
ncbi:hypothetical protein IL38_23915 [Actinopolyspora erythraea]|uniref:PH domain-containing protein n=1 Tax=Actinopolyspora erythraea TaxID=414996 RepID=A0ABR4WYQ2_9ACTN|nr:hypothetical protein IL38_23915 [Actinopolyspora erythraea]